MQWNAAPYDLTKEGSDAVVLRCCPHFERDKALRLNFGSVEQIVIYPFSYKDNVDYHTHCHDSEE